MQIQDFAPTGATTTILLGRNRLNALMENRLPVVKSFDRPAPAPRASHSLRKQAALAALVAKGAMNALTGRIDHTQLGNRQA
jgi:hypothetical protein